jgi:hypothetical protein
MVPALLPLSSVNPALAFPDLSGHEPTRRSSGRLARTTDRRKPLFGNQLGLDADAFPILAGETGRCPQRTSRAVFFGLLVCEKRVQ